MLETVRPNNILPTVLSMLGKKSGSPSSLTPLTWLLWELSESLPLVSCSQVSGLTAVRSIRGRDEGPGSSESGSWDRFFGVENRSPVLSSLGLLLIVNSLLAVRLI